MSKVILLNGSPHANGCTATALNEMIKIFETHNIETELVHLGSTDISVKLHNRNVDTKFYMEDDRSYELIMNNIVLYLFLNPKILYLILDQKSI